MAIFVNLAMSLVQSAHGTAFLIGGMAYLGYISLMVSPVPTSQPKDADTAQRRGNRLQEAWPIGLWSLFVVVLACFLALSPGPANQCPVLDYSSATPQEVKSWESWNAYVSEKDGEAHAPVGLLRAAHAALDGGDDETARGGLRACVAWAPEQGGLDAVGLEELHAQMECHGELLEQGGSSAREAAALAASGREVLQSARARGAEDPKIHVDLQVEWARVVHGSLQIHLDTATQLVRAQRSRKVHGPAAIAALAAVGETRGPFEESLRAAAVAMKELLDRGEGSADEASELRHHLAASRISIVGLVREARQLAQEVKGQAAADSNLANNLRCPAEALEKLEKLAVKEGEREAAYQSKLRNQAQFALGEYYSELAVEEGTDESRGLQWVLDTASGVHVPSKIAHAEALLSEGAEGGSDDDKAERSAMRALRLYHHAKLLAKRHHDGAAEWRYRASAKLSARYKRNKLAAHALSRLAYLYVQRGRKGDAIEAIKEAQAYGGNPLTKYLKTVLLRGSGQLTTAADLRASDAALGEVAGKLPSKALEEQRATLHAEVQFWHEVAEGSIWQCLHAKDVAHVLICFLCRFLFPAAATESGEP